MPQLLEPFHFTEALSMADFSESNITLDTHCLMSLRHRHLSLRRLAVDIQPEQVAMQAPAALLLNLDIKPATMVTMKEIPPVLHPSLEPKRATIVTIKEIPPVLLPSPETKAATIVTIHNIRTVLHLSLETKAATIVTLKDIPAVLLTSLKIRLLPIMEIKAVLEVGAQTDPQEGNVTTAAAEDRHNILSEQKPQAGDSHPKIATGFSQDWTYNHLSMATPMEYQMRTSCIQGFKSP
jgi:hypothetical protein